MLRAFTLTGVLLSATALAAAATPPPKVVFIGDWITAGWTLPANANWVNKGVGTSGEGTTGVGTSSATLARFQSDVVSLHPSVVHIMVGSDDAFIVYDSFFDYYIPVFLSNLDAMVKEAKAANIKVILGMESQAFEFAGNLEPLNAVISAYAAANNIPVVNYGDALCGCVESLGASQTGNFAPNGPLLVSVDQSDSSSPFIPTAGGYAVMTQMAQTAINILTTGATLKSGYLQNSQQPNPNEGNTDGAPVPNVNSVGSNAVVKFVPMGVYSNAGAQPQLNSTYAGFGGTWTSSNPLVMSITQNGLATALTTGSATISYTAPSGLHFSPWIMHVSAALP